MNYKDGANEILFNFIKMIPSLDYVDNDNNNFLHHIVKHGSTEHLNQILDEAKSKGQLSGIINNLNNNGKTPLHIAVSNNDQKSADLLIKYGASKEIVDNKGQKIMWVETGQKGGGKRKKITGKRFI